MNISQILNYLSQIKWLLRLEDLIFGLPYYAILTAVLLAVLFPLGYCLARTAFLDRINGYLVIAAGGFLSLSFLTLLVNGLAYSLGTPMAFSAALIPFLLFDLIVMTNSGVRQVIKTLNFKDVKSLLLITLPLIIFLFLALYKLPNFDEEFHVPVIATLLKGNFPIVQPTNPFWLRHYDYHYGWQLAAASISSWFRISPQIGLDLVKIFSLIFGVSAMLGIFNNFRLSSLTAIKALYASLFIGPFWFFMDNFTRQYIYLKTVDIISFPIIQNLQAVSHYSIFVFFLLIALIGFGYENPFSDFRRKILYGFVLSVLFLFLGLTGEYYLLLLGMFFILVSFIHLSYLLFFRKQNIITHLTGLVLIFIPFVLSLLISTVQGGSLSGVLNPGLITDIRLPGIISHFVLKDPLSSYQAVQNITSVVTRPIIALRSVADWGFIKEDRKYLSIVNVSAWPQLFPYAGIFEIAVYPAFLIISLIWLIRKRQNINYLLLFLLFIAYTLPLIKLLFTTRYGDQNLVRGDMLYQAIYYAFSVWFVSQIVKSRILKGFFWTLVILSSLSAVVFVFGVFLIKPSIGPYKIDTSLKSPADRQLITRINSSALRGNILSVNSISDSLTSQTGLISYRTFFEFYPNIYRKVISDLNPEDLKIIKADLLYVNNELLSGLSATGQKNLDSGFTKLYEVRDGPAYAGLYSLIN